MRPLPSAHALAVHVRHGREARRERPPASAIVRPGPGQESVWDYPRPPRVEPVAQIVRVVFGGRQIADSKRALRVVETAGAPCYYLPPDDVAMDALHATGDWSICEWKGIGYYYDVVQGERTAPHAAWTYPEPFTDLGQGYERIAHYVAFYAGKMDACYVGDALVRPQEGGFYGGWITPNLTGPIKGVPGSEGW